MILIRATHNRRVETAGHLLRQKPVAGQYTLELRRKEDVPARQARMSVRYATLTIQPPKPRLKEPGLQPLQLQVILAEEDSPPTGHALAAGYKLACVKFGRCATLFALVLADRTLSLCAQERLPIHNWRTLSA